jgi:putative flippase GtrA
MLLNIFKKYKSFLLFCVIGVSNTLVDVLVFNVIVFFLNGGNVVYLFAKSFGFLVANINSYLLNSKFTFSEKKYSANVFKNFLIVSISGFFINTAAGFLTYKLLNMYFGQSIVTMNASVLLALLASTYWNYFFYSRLIFHKND